MRNDWVKHKLCIVKYNLLLRDSRPRTVKKGQWFFLLPNRDSWAYDGPHEHDLHKNYRRRDPLRQAV